MAKEKRLAIVGGAGLVGRALSQHALAEGWVPVSLDRIRSAVAGVEHHPLDLLLDDVTAALREASASVVVHLAARVDPPTPRGRARMRRLHVNGTRAVSQACVDLGVERLVLCSSAVVYGAWPDNPVPIDEDQPVRPRSDFPYGVDKAAQEAEVEKVASAVQTVVARPAIIYGPEAKNYLTEFIRLAPGVLPAIDGHRPPLDFVHVEDVASALFALATEPGVSGAYNIASRQWSTFDEVARAARLRVVRVPRRLLAPVLDLGARWVPAHLRAPSYILDHLTFPFVTSSGRLQAATGWRPVYAARDALAAMLRGSP